MHRSQHLGRRLLRNAAMLLAALMRYHHLGVHQSIKGYDLPCRYDLDSDLDPDLDQAVEEVLMVMTMSRGERRSGACVCALVIIPLAYEVVRGIFCFPAGGLFLMSNNPSSSSSSLEMAA